MRANVNRGRGFGRPYEYQIPNPESLLQSSKRIAQHDRVVTIGKRGKPAFVLSRLDRPRSIHQSGEFSIVRPLERLLEVPPFKGAQDGAIREVRQWRRR